MTSEQTYDRLEETTMASGDKAELLMDDLGKKKSVPKSESSSSGGLNDESAALKKPKKVLEAGKAVFQDHSRGLRLIVISSFIFSFVITVALILSIYLGPPQIGANAAVATDVKQCSDIGLQMLKEGGNAVDAAVAAMFCVGVVNAESSGLGGGGFMLVHDHKEETSEVFDFRETAPALATANMYSGDKGKENMKLGPLSVGVPGELRGMEAAHKKHGKLAWSKVVSPAADLARKGFEMTGHTDYVINHPTFDLQQFMMSKLKRYYTKDSGRTLKTTGDWITREDLATTLDKIAEEGSDVFYTGSVADDIIKEIANAKTPGILTKDDLRNYKVEKRDVVKTTYHGFTIESVPAPGSGPVLLSIMNMLEGYKLKQDNVSYHRLLEAYKFGYANKELLGDPKFNEKDIVNASNIMISKEEAVRLRNITTNKAMNASFYGNIVGLPVDKGTSHISVIDSAELIVSVTSTVNHWFGSMVVTDSGILLNDEMADFNRPGEGSKLNEVAPGKRPLSSMVPTVVYETGHLCGLRMVSGAANGSRIITGVAETILNNLTFGMSLNKSIAAPRLHNQLYDPDAKVVEAEVGFSEEIIKDLEKMGHVVQTVDEELSIVNAVLKIKDDIEAVSDPRKKGSGAAKFE